MYKTVLCNGKSFLCNRYGLKIRAWRNLKSSINNISPLSLIVVHT